VPTLAKEYLVVERALASDPVSLVVVRALVSARVLELDIRTRCIALDHSANQELLANCPQA
jgi:hypothetical protein